VIARSRRGSVHLPERPDGDLDQDTGAQANDLDERVSLPHLRGYDVVPELEAEVIGGSDVVRVERDAGTGLPSVRRR